MIYPRTSLTAAVFGALATAAWAEYPERPINMVIPFGPGGATDISARAIAGPLSEASGATIVPVNVAGAGGAAGTVQVKNAEPDGYTMAFIRVATHSVNPAMKSVLPYSLEDFDYVGIYEINPVVCAVNAQSDIMSMEDLVEKIAAEPGQVAYASSGVGTLLHLAGAMVLSEFGVDDPVENVIHIPTKSGGEAAAAILTGTADLICANSSALAGMVANEQLRPLLVTTSEPVTGFDAPTANDLGHERLNLLVGWTGIAGPAGLSDEVKEDWSTWMKEAAADPDFVVQMESVGSIIELMDPQEAAAFIDEQFTAFSEVVTDLGMRVEG